MKPPRSYFSCGFHYHTIRHLVITALFVYAELTFRGKVYSVSTNFHKSHRVKGKQHATVVTMAPTPLLCFLFALMLVTRGA